MQTNRKIEEKTKRRRWKCKNDEALEVEDQEKIEEKMSESVEDVNGEEGTEEDETVEEYKNRCRGWRRCQRIRRRRNKQINTR